MSETKTTKQIKGYTNVLAGRLGGLTLDFGDGIEVDIRALTYSQYAYVVALGQPEYALNMARIGIKEVRGIDAQWDTLSICGVDYRVPALSWLGSMMPAFVIEIANQVTRLSLLNSDELSALDFTSPVPGQE